MKIIAIANQKGGTAKTTTTAALGVLLSRRGRRVQYGAEGTGTLSQREGGLPTDIGPGFPVIALDLSRSGTSFLCNYGLETNDVVLLEMPSRDGLQKQLHARVVHCKRTGLNAFQIGAEFINPDEQADNQS